jgi:Type II secretion system (T2SS), protein M subtype b
VIARLPARQRRFVALGVLGLVALLLAALVWLPFAYLERQRAALAAGQQRVDVLRARVPTREELLRRLQQLEGSGSLQEALLAGSTPAVAAAQLQGDLSALAAAMGGEIVAIQILEPEEAPPFVRIGLRLTMTGDIATMRDFLYAIETRNPVLIVSSMNLVAASSEAADVAADPELNASFEVYGYAPPAIIR